jgi:hypothetical protein
MTHGREKTGENAMSDEYSHDLDVTDDDGEDFVERQIKTQDLIEYHMNIIKMVDLISLAKDQMESVYNNMTTMELDKEHNLVFNRDLMDLQTEIH